MGTRFDSSAYSIEGRRTGNEDSYLEYTIRDGWHFLAVADGMGGTAGGQLASSTVIEAAEDVLRKYAPPASPPDDLKAVIGSIFEAANEAIRACKKRHPEFQGMGTTLACVLIAENKYVYGNLGDSRIYLLRNGELQQITEDHTYIQQFVNETGQRPEPSMVEMYGNMIIKSLDGGNDRPDISPPSKEFETLEAGDAFLLCSDGLITDKGMQTAEHLARPILTTESLQEAVLELARGAMADGSTDNITVVLGSYGQFARVQEPSSDKRYPPTGFPKRLYVTSRKMRTLVFSVLGVLLALTVGALGWLLLRSSNEEDGPNLPSKTDQGGSVEQTAEQEGELKSKSIDVIPPGLKVPAAEPGPWLAFKDSDIRFSLDISTDEIRWRAYEPSNQLISYEVQVDGGPRHPTGTNNFYPLKDLGLEPGKRLVKVFAKLKSGAVVTDSAEITVIKS